MQEPIMMGAPPGPPKKLEWKKLKEAVELDLHNIEIKGKLLSCQLQLINKQMGIKK